MCVVLQWWQSILSCLEHGLIRGILLEVEHHKGRILADPISKPFLEVYVRFVEIMPCIPRILLWMLETLHLFLDIVISYCFLEMKTRSQAKSRSKWECKFLKRDKRISNTGEVLFYQLIGDMTENRKKCRKSRTPGDYASLTMSQKKCF